MKVDKIFDALLENLKVGDASTTVAARRDEITKALNKDFRSVEGSTANRFMVGSYGRHTAIRGVSDAADTKPGGRDPARRQPPRRRPVGTVTS